MPVSRAQLELISKASGSPQESAAWWLAWVLGIGGAALLRLSPRSFEASTGRLAIGPEPGRVHVQRYLHIDRASSSSLVDVLELATGTVCGRPFSNRFDATRRLAEVGRRAGLGGRLTFQRLQRGGLVALCERQGWGVARSVAVIVGCELTSALDAAAANHGGEGAVISVPSVRLRRGRLSMDSSNAH